MKKKQVKRVNKLLNQVSQTSDMLNDISIKLAKMLRDFEKERINDKSKR
jgi:hypothetical protein